MVVLLCLRLPLLLGFCCRGGTSEIEGWLCANLNAGTGEGQ